MGMLMLASAALFQRSTAVSLGAAAVAEDGTNARPQQLLLRGSSPDNRQLFDPRPPYDFYNGACQSECAGDDDLMPFDNACPKCPEKYESQHCNHCCYGGASSLRIRWHGCPGVVTFASSEQGTQDCELDADETSIVDALRFIECSCYELINTPETFDASACQPLATTLTISSDDGMDSDICIVSVTEKNEGTTLIDLSKPLPNVIGLVRKLFAGFDPEKVARFLKRIEKLLLDPSIVRNRLKIESTVSNAQAFLRVQEEFGSFSDYIWGFVDGKPCRTTGKDSDVPATSPESDALSKKISRSAASLR